MAGKKTETGRCARCGAAADVVWYSRGAVRPLELCSTHNTEHADAIKRGEWTDTPHTPTYG